MVIKQLRKQEDGMPRLAQWKIFAIIGATVFAIIYLFEESILIAKVNVGGTHTHTNAESQSQSQSQSLQQAQMCFPTTSYRFVEIDQESHAIIFKSYYGSKQKSMGGDELYPTLVFNQPEQGNEQVVATGHVYDLSDGRYAILFEGLIAPEDYDFGDKAVSIPGANFSTHTNISLSQVEMGNATFTFKNILQYSCGIGALPPPTKDCEPGNGALNILTPLHYPFSWLTMQNQKPPRSEPQINLKQFDRVIPIGDSLIWQFLNGADWTKVTIPWAKQFWIQFPLATDTVQQYFDVIKDHCQNDTLFSTPTPKEGTCSTNRTMLFLNSGVWDSMEDGSKNTTLYRCQRPYKNSQSSACCDYDYEFSNHIQALRQLFTAIKEAYPKVTIAWKSMTALHVHNVKCRDNGACDNRAKYMSSSRAEKIFWKQKKLLDEEFPDVLFVDVYNLTRNVAHESKPNDGRHYKCPRPQKSNVCKKMWSEAFGESGYT